MSNSTINFTINLDGNAYTEIAQIDKALGNVLVSVKKHKKCTMAMIEALCAPPLRENDGNHRRLI